MEEIMMELVVNSGNAKSLAMNAIEEAEDGNFLQAKALIDQAQEAISSAHHFQTNLIQQEASGNPVPLNLILVHGQDHLMNAILVIEMAERFIKMYQKING